MPTAPPKLSAEEVVNKLIAIKDVLDTTTGQHAIHELIMEFGGYPPPDTVTLETAPESAPHASLAMSPMATEFTDVPAEDEDEDEDWFEDEHGTKSKSAGGSKTKKKK